MASDAIGGAITFSTAIDNSDLEKGLEDAQKRVEELKKQLEEKEAAKSAIEEQLDKANESIDNTINEIDRLKSEMESLKDVDPMDSEAWWSAAQTIADNQQRVVELNEALKEQEANHATLLGQYREMETQVAQYNEQLVSAQQTQESLSQRVSSFYYQAGKAMQSSMDSVAESVSRIGQRISNLLTSALVFGVLRQGLNALKNGIADALMQNEQFSASWAYLTSAAQGFANGIANAVAPVVVQVIHGITSSIMAVARVLDSVFKTSLSSSIEAAQKAAQEAWRQTDESKAAQKQAEANEKARAKQQEQYAKAQERYAEQQRKAAERAAKAQESLDKRKTAEEQKYTDALEDAAERQAEAEKSAAEKAAAAQQTAQERMAKAQEKAAERQRKAEESAQKRLEKAQQTAQERYEKAQESAAERTRAAQEAYDSKVVAAQAKDAKAAAAAETKQAKAAQKLEKAQKKANATLLGFDELNKMNAESTAEVTDAITGDDGYTSALEEIEDPKQYTVDPEDYMVDPSEYEIDPTDYVVDPNDYAVKLDKYTVDPEDFFVDPEDYSFDPSEYVIDPEDYAVDPFSFDWQEFPEIGAEEGLKPDWDAFDVGKIDEKITTIMAILAGAKLAVGAVLAFSGVNIPLGLALMALGALEMAGIMGENWDALPAEVQGAITGALMLVGIALLVIGAVLAFSGVNIPVGAGMMAAGALLLGYATALNWNSLSPQLQATATTLMAVVGGFLFAFGVFLCMTGNIPIGVGLMIAGAGTVAGVAALNWNALNGTMQEKIAVIGQIVAGALFGLGVMLCLAGHIPLGIGLMIAGVAILGITQVVANWDTIGPLLEEHLNELLAAAMFGLFAIGVLLLLMGNIPFGVGCIVASAIAGVSLAVINWDTLKPLLEEHLNEILTAAMAALFAIGVVLCFIGNLPLGIGCIVAATIAGVTLAVINWDTLKPLLEEHLNDILVLAMGALFVIGVILCLVGNLPLGIGCIVASAIAGVTLAVINWDFLKEKAQKVWEGLVAWWSNGPAKVFTPEFWQGVFKCIGDAFLGIINSIIEWWNNMWAGISEGLGNLVGATGGSYQSSSNVPSVRPPGLARGAVIPPNRQFMAVLGDQTRGNNIETPESLMRQVVREEAGGMMAEMMMQMQAMGGGVDGGGDTNLTLYIDSEELARATAKGSSSLTRRGVLSPSATFV